MWVGLAGRWEEERFAKDMKKPQTPNLTLSSLQAVRPGSVSTRCLIGEDGNRKALTRRLEATLDSASQPQLLWHDANGQGGRGSTTTAEPSRHG